jgi:hypothetical protein
MRILAIILTIAIIVLAAGQTPRPVGPSSTLGITRQATSGGGLLYVSPPNITGQRINTQFNVSIQVTGMDYFTGWDVSIETNTSAINPIKISITGNLFDANYSQHENLVSNCINGNGTTCSLPPIGLDGPGVVHSAADLLGRPAIPTPIVGSLFTITYNVTSNPSYSPIRIIGSTLTDNSSPTGVPNTPQDGVYGSPSSPDFTLSVSTKSLAIPQGTSSTLTVAVHSLLKFNGTIDLSTIGKLNGTFAQQSLNLTASNGTKSTTLTLFAPYSTSATLYPVMIVADYATTIRHTASLQVNVQPTVSFLMGFDHGQMPIHGGLSANVTILVTSQFNFSGEVDLTVNTAETNVTYTLESSVLQLTPHGTNSTIITLTPPLSTSRSIYYIFVTASHRFPTFWQNITEPIKIVPPAPSLAITTNPVELSVRAGQAANVTVTVWSVDFFYGYAYVSAVMSGGRASFDHYSYFFPLQDPTNPVYAPAANYTLTIKIGARTIPGNYVILLAAYSITNGNQTATSTQASILLTVFNPTLFHTSSAPIKILGLAPSTYYMLVGIVAIPFAFLVGMAVRKWKDDQDDEYLKD